jgi:hypothetical protein
MKTIDKASFLTAFYKNKLYLQHAAGSLLSYGYLSVYGGNIKMELQIRMGGCGFNKSASEQISYSGPCEHGTGLSVLTKCWK